MQLLGPSDTELFVGRRILRLRVPDVAMPRLIFNLPLYWTQPCCLTSKTPSPSFSYLNFSHFAELLRGELNGDWGGQGALDVDGADGEHCREDDNDSSIDKGYGCLMMQKILYNCIATSRMATYWSHCSYVVFCRSLFFPDTVGFGAVINLSNHIALKLL